MPHSRRITWWRALAIATALLLIPQSIWAGTPDAPQVKPGARLPAEDERERAPSRAGRRLHELANRR